MSHHFATAVATIFIALCVTPATAQNIYRCGETYSQQPCAGGKLVTADDARTSQQRTDAQAAAQRDAKAAEAMEKARMKQESQPAQAVLPPDKVAPASERPADKPVMSKPKKPQYFTAVAPAKPKDKPVKKKKKAAKKEAG
ncbi:MAG: hypothetical protein ABI907_08240 [Ramlibacter sp.]